MTPEEAHTLAAIVEAVDDAGGVIRETDVDHKQVGGMANAMHQLIGGEAQTRPVFTLEIAADPSDVLEQLDEDVPDESEDLDDRPHTEVADHDDAGDEDDLGNVEISLDDPTDDTDSDDPGGDGR